MKRNSVCLEGARKEEGVRRKCSKKIVGNKGETTLNICGTRKKNEADTKNICCK
jgi:hypothetical protein